MHYKLEVSKPFIDTIVAAFELLAAGKGEGRIGRFRRINAPLLFRILETRVLFYHL